MAHLWLEESSATGRDPEWVVQPLDGESAVPLTGPHNRHNGPGAPHVALLLCSRMAEAQSWLIMSMAPAGVALNGKPLRTGIRALTDRDEIRIDGVGRMFFSTEQLARVEAFPGADRPVYCARCKQAIEAGAAAVRCPQCRVWYHQSDELPCWTYAPHCALCPQLTALDAGYQWTPAEIGA